MKTLTLLWSRARPTDAVNHWYVVESGLEFGAGAWGTPDCCSHPQGWETRKADSHKSQLLRAGTHILEEVQRADRIRTGGGAGCSSGFRDGVRAHSGEGRAPGDRAGVRNDDPGPVVAPGLVESARGRGRVDGSHRSPVEAGLLPVGSGLQAAAGQPGPYQERAGSEDRCEGCAMDRAVDGMRSVAGQFRAPAGDSRASGPDAIPDGAGARMEPRSAAASQGSPRRGDQVVVRRDRHHGEIRTGDD